MADESGSSSGELVSSDDIFLNSSDSEQEAEYIVEQILAERLSDDSRPRYLVKWEDYSEERCDLASPPPPPPDLCSLTQFFPFPLTRPICQDVLGSPLNLFSILEAFETGQRSAVQVFSSLMIWF